MVYIEGIGTGIVHFGYRKKVSVSVSLKIMGTVTLCTPAVGFTLFYIQMIIGKTMRPFAICYWVFGIVQINEELQLTSAVVGAIQKIIEVSVKLI